MTDLLRAAFEAASERLGEAEQDALAVDILAAVNGDADREWDQKFAATLPELDRLAAKAIDEHRRGGLLL